MNYDAATAGSRGNSFHVNSLSADSAAMRQRSRLAFVARDMIRNTPLATRVQAVIANNVVGDGIIPKVMGRDAKGKAALLSIIEQHLDTTDIDADGRNTLYGLQRLAINTVVDAGEVLIRRRWRQVSDGFALPFQVQVLEPDYLDATRDGVQSNGNIVREGIEFDLIGRRVAYWLHRQHPGEYARNFTSRLQSSRVSAADVIHIFRQDRPGQMRGVSWLSNVAMQLQDLADFQDAQLMRQKIAACFAAFRVSPDGEIAGDDPADLSESIIPGRIQNLAPGEDIRFADPPGVSGYDEFTRSVIRTVSVGMGLTYEAVSGDLSNVNFSSGRMGRMEMDRNVSAWQQLMLIPQMMHPIGKWMLEAWDMVNGTTRRTSISIAWVAPMRLLVDPAGEVKMWRDKIRSGLASRSDAVRALGFDPERLMTEIEADNADADAKGLVFDSDPRRVSLAGTAQSTDPMNPSDGANNVGQ